MKKLNKRQIKKRDKATWQQKFQAELGRNRELIMKNGAYEKGVLQMRMMIDSILIRAAINYGVKSSESYDLELPNESVEDILKVYSLETIKEGEKLVLHVTKK